MTNEELENKIAEKFVSIMRKLRNLVVEHLTQNCPPCFKTVVMACMKMMDEEKINFTLSSKEQQATNEMFLKLNVPDGIRLVPNFSGSNETLRQFNASLKMLKNNQKLINFYNLLGMVDTLLDAKDIYDKLETLHELSLKIEQECNQGSKQ